MLVCDFLRDSASRYPDKTACVSGERRLTFGEIDAQSNRLARALMDAGVRKGGRVAVYLDNCPEAVVSVWGIMKAGAACVVLNVTTKPDKLCRLLNDCAPAAIVMAGRAKDATAAICERVDSIACVIACGPTPPADEAQPKRCLDFETALAAFSSAHVPPQHIDMDLAALVYTSGSTGQPKGVVHTHHSLASAISSITEYIGNAPDDVVLGVLPLSFTYGMSQLLTTAKAGATLVLERSFAYPFQVVQRVKEERVTGFPGVPMIFGSLLRLKKIAPEDFDSVRYVTNAGAALPPAYIAPLRALFRNARIFAMYGQTECVRAAYMPPGELDANPTSVGRGMPNQETYLIDEEGKRLPPGATGELVVRGSHVMHGYWRDPERTAKALRAGRHPLERVLHTGDLFRMDEDGRLYFVSRKDDIIKSRGEKVSPIEVENVIAELPEVEHVAVIGVADPLLGEAVKAFVVKAPDAALSERAVIAHCARNLENFMVPKFVEFRDSLPSTSSGKVKKSELKSGEGGSPE